MATVTINDDSFETEVIKSTAPVLVDFWAEWCGPCKMIAPILEEVSETLGSKLTVAKMNIEDSPLTPSKLGVRGIPTMMLFKDGKMKAMKVGSVPKATLLAWLAENGVS
jgi:thioredoxin 1